MASKVFFSTLASGARKVASEQKRFLKIIASNWEREFPLVKPVDLPHEVPRAPKGSNFLCDAHADTRSLYYFINLDFSPKRRGELTIYITASPSPTKSVLPVEMIAPHPSPNSVGTFGIWR